MVNELSIYATKNIQQGINRSARHEFLTNIIKGCQQINGLLTGTMCRDASWQFLRLGRNLERADMTTRLLDAGAAAQLEGEVETDMHISQVVWGNVLRSSSAELSYRRTMRSAVHERDVAEFLLENPDFPRSFRFCIDSMINGIKNLPNNAAAKKALHTMLEVEFELDSDKRLGFEFREYLNQQQVNLGNLHQVFNQNWFAMLKRGTE